MSLKDLPLFDAPGSGDSDDPESLKPKHWTVTELTHKIKGVLEPPFQNVWVQGEVSNYRPAASGHAYFSLKDAQANISAAAFGWGAKRAKFELKDGLQILCRGKVSVYAPRGNYQLVIDQIEPLGAGALQVAFEQLKARLQAEGLFDPKRKRTLPSYPKRVAVITSPSGAVIQDMLNILKRRAPHVSILLVPAVVQGDAACEQLIRGLEIVNRWDLADVIVLARGGGSMEDLWCFNDEGLARAIAQSKLPVISAVGHEVDFTIADFVADLRAPTPSAAAEIVSGHWVDSTRRLREFFERLKVAVVRDLTMRKNLLSHVTARVVSPRDRLREQAQRTDELFLRLERAIRVHFQRRSALVEQCVGKLDALSPLRVLERGYALVREANDQGQIIKSSRQLQPGQSLRITFHDGDREVQAK